MSSPTQRSIAHAKKLGYQVAIVEKYNMFARVRQDLFGFGDLLCMKPNAPLLLVQCTSTDNMASRLAKIRGLQASADWLSTGNFIEIHGWSKRGKAGRRKLWTLKVCPVTLSLLS